MTKMSQSYHSWLEIIKKKKNTRNVASVGAKLQVGILGFSSFIVSSIPPQSTEYSLKSFGIQLCSSRILDLYSHHRTDGEFFLQSRISRIIKDFVSLYEHHWLYVCFCKPGNCDSSVDKHENKAFMSLIVWFWSQLRPTEGEKKTSKRK